MRYCMSADARAMPSDISLSCVQALGLSRLLSLMTFDMIVSVDDVSDNWYNVGMVESTTVKTDVNRSVEAS